MYPAFKKVVTMKPYCPECKEMLKGDNSVIQPYTCKCGEWRLDYLGEQRDYKIIKKKQ